jgi:hypothetical protein
MSAMFMAKAIAVFRGSTAASSVTVASVNAEVSSGDPAAQTVTASAGTTPLVVIGAYSTIFASVDPRTFAPTKDGEIAVGTAAYLAYKLYNSTPADVSIDMDDEASDNALQSCYLQVSLVSPVLTADPGAFTVTGSAAILVQNRRLSADAGVFTVNVSRMRADLRVRASSSLRDVVRAVCLIPATGEAAYGTQPYFKVSGGTAWTSGHTVSLNVHTTDGRVDAVMSIDQLQAAFPDLESVALTVAWFGSDLRAANCTIVPKVENRDPLSPSTWTVGAYTKTSASIVNSTNSVLNYGGTPSDATVLEMIALLKARGLRVVLYPFLLMDISYGNVLPNPYSDNAATLGQETLPWRGRITCSPAPGYVGTVDKTATAATQINTFFTAYNAFITHYANLSVTAGGVDGFLLGSEMVALTTVRSSLGVYPAVTNLVSLAATVKTTVGASCDVGYAADWSEFVHSSTEGLWFHLDPLWSSANVDFVGVDNYLPVSDWRSSRFHLDYGSNPSGYGPYSLFDSEYIRGQIEGGEYYDYYYASISDRDAQTRTPITDPVYSEPWANRRKDFAGWWANAHHNRPAWVRDASPTAWAAYSKPIWFTEFGCPAVDKGTNQPNVFYDPKSSESAFPYYSTAARDDGIQRLYLETMLTYWAVNSPSHLGLTMVEPSNMFVWAWDARPYPYFPRDAATWADVGNYTYGHWLNGRVDAVSLDTLVAALCEEAGLGPEQYDVTALTGPNCIVSGMTIDSVSTIRDALEQLASVYFFSGVESDGVLKFTLKNRVRNVAVSYTDLVVEDGDAVGIKTVRNQNAEIPSLVSMSFYDKDKNYEVASVSATTNTGDITNTEQLSVPISMDGASALAITSAVAQQALFSREEGSARLPLSYAYIDVGDSITFTLPTQTMTVLATKVSLSELVDIDFVTFSPYQHFVQKGEADTSAVFGGSQSYASPELVFLDIPIAASTDATPWAPRIAAYASPWPGGVDVYREIATDTYQLVNTHTFINTIGTTLYDFYDGPVGSWDMGNSLYVELSYGTLLAADPLTVLNSGLVVAVRNADLEWELLQFADCELISAGVYRLSTLLRGQLGTEYAMRTPVAAGALIVVIDNDVSMLNIPSSLASMPVTYRYGPTKYAYSSDAFSDVDHTGTRAALKPYSPCNAWITRWTSTSWSIFWTRRTRFDGDDWDVAEVPLHEETAQFNVDIMSGATVLSSHIVTGVWADAQELAYDWTPDFASEPDSLDVVISQYGAAYGNYGTPLTTTIYKRKFA